MHTIRVSLFALPKTESTDQKIQGKPNYLNECMLQAFSQRPLTSTERNKSSPLLLGVSLGSQSGLFNSI
jgi:hypothetical protein